MLIFKSKCRENRSYAKTITPKIKKIEELFENNIFFLVCNHLWSYQVRIRIHTGFHRFTEIGQIFYNLNIYLHDKTFQVEILPVSIYPRSVPAYLLVTCFVRTKKKLIKNFLPMRFEFQRDRTERSNFIPGGG